MRKTIDSDTCPKYLWLLMSYNNRKKPLEFAIRDDI